MQISQVWPEWQEDCVLGEGSFGKVYRAKRVEYGRTFYSAIKVLTVPKNQQEIKQARSQGMNDAEIYEYFKGLVGNLLNEISLMDNLKGAKNIVGIEDYKIIEHEGEIGWDIFIRMELLTPFDSFISNPSFSQLDVIKLGIDICTALEGCEQNYIVHRDIKPDNIFISRFGEFKLGDFGIARKLEATQANLSRKGTLNYMAPEVYKSEEYGSNVDIYSLGLVLYTLLNNNRIAFLPPYPQPITYKDNELALSRRLSGEALLPPCNADASLGMVIVKACAYFPSERYQTATEFKNALIKELNRLSVYGNGGELQNEAIHFTTDVSGQLNSTTNDMTANGKLVAGEFMQSTSVLNEVSYQTNEAYDSLSLENYNNNVKSSKTCRILAYIVTAITLILSVILLSKDIGVIGNTTVIAMLCCCVSMFISGRNKYAVGVSVMTASLVSIEQGITLFLPSLKNTLSVPGIIFLVSGLLMLFGGLVLLVQKNIRLGGTLCIYSCIIEWLINIYSMINKEYTANLLHIAINIFAVSVFLWTYGYSSIDKCSGFRKVMYFIAFAPILLVIIRVFLTLKYIF